MKRWLLIAALVGFLITQIEITAAGDRKAEPADLILHHAKVLTVDAKFTIADAIAIKGDRVLAVGSNNAVMAHNGPRTKVIDLKGKTVMPGLYDSHTHPTGAATREFDEEIPYLKSLDDVFSYIRKKTKELPEGDWIVLRFAFPTRDSSRCDGRFHRLAAD